MFEVFVWVPTKGWKLLWKIKDEELAKMKAEELEPLETMVSHPTRGRIQWTGGPVMVVH